MCKTCGCDPCKCGERSWMEFARAAASPTNECSCKVVSTREDPKTYFCNAHPFFGDLKTFFGLIA